MNPHAIVPPAQQKGEFEAGDALIDPDTVTVFTKANILPGGDTSASRGGHAYCCVLGKEGGSRGPPRTSASEEPLADISKHSSYTHTHTPPLHMQPSLTSTASSPTTTTERELEDGAAPWLCAVIDVT